MVRAHSRADKIAARVLGAYCALVLSSIAAGQESRQTFTFAYLQRAGDAYYAPHRAYTGLALRDRQRPLAGAELALRESRVLARALDIEFELLQRELADVDDPVTIARALVQGGAVRALLLDLPLADVISLGESFTGDDALLFNIRHTDDRLRGNACSPALLHTVPSRAMLMDAMAQFLIRKRWKQTLLLQGGRADDAALADAFVAAASKFGVTIVTRRTFELGTDPRARDQNNVSLLTSGVTYDVVFLADSYGEFGRYVPFNTQRPRPVIGSEGLMASAWHFTWERHGGPQLNQRFDKRAARHMSDSDYAAWAAVKAVVEALARASTSDARALQRYLTSSDMTLDTYKGAAGNFRAWDGQLRQPILLHTANAVIERAPLRGFLHQHNELDTLGHDQRESPCIRRR